MSNQSLSELSDVLWRERDLMELLLFKLDEEQLLLAAGRQEWLPRATREVEVVLERISEAEIVRSMVVSSVGRELGLGGDPSLRELASSAPEPWDGLLLEHRRAFLELSSRIQGLAEANRELVRAAKAAADQVMSAFDRGEEDMVTTYAPSNLATKERAPSRPRLLDGAL